MEKKNIDKAFENRWRIKSDGLEDDECRRLLGKKIKELCRDFFEAGICIGEGEQTSAIVKSAEDVEVIDADFETWWNLYQKKRGKEKCMKKWAKLSKKDKLACIAATPAYVASTPDVTYRKDPYTYLNNSSWNDEIYFRNGTDNKPTIEEQRISRLASILTD